MSAGRALGWALVLLALALTGARWLDVPSSPVVLVQSLSPLAAPLCLVGAAAGLLLPGRGVQRTGLAATCALTLAVHTAIWVPWLTRDAPGPGRKLEVMTANLFRGRADAHEISRAVRVHGVDVLVLTEVTNAADSRLRAAGVYRRLPYTVPHTATAGTTVIRSRLRLTAGPAPPGVAAPPSRNPTVTLRLGTGLALRAVHPSPPTPQQVRQWRATLAELTAWAQHTSGPLIMAGDFNASVDHPGMRQLLAQGLRDAHEVAGEGRPRTWPNGRSAPAFVHLDHVLVRGLDVASVHELRLSGSDHDAILAELVVPAER